MKFLLKTVSCFEHEGVPVMQMNMRPTRCLAFMILLVVLLGAPTSLWALTLGEAKAKGLVGETSSGYLGIVSGKGSREVQALMKGREPETQAEISRHCQTERDQSSNRGGPGGKNRYQENPTGAFHPASIRKMDQKITHGRQPSLSSPS